MNESLYQYREQSPLRTFLSIAGYGMMFTYSLLFLGVLIVLMVKGWSNYGWLLRGDMNFAPHWEAPQRAAMQQLEHAVRCDNSIFTDVQGLFAEELESDDEDGTLGAALRRDAYTMPYSRKADDALREFVQTSPDKARQLLLQKNSDLHALVYASSEMAQWPAMRFFVEMGFPVNQTTADGETLLTSVLSNMQSRPTAEVLEQADWLRSKGAEVRADSATWDSIDLADDAEATLEWLLQQGLSLELWKDKYRGVSLPLDVCVSHGVALSVFERLVKEGKLNVNDTRAHATYLQLATDAVRVEAVRCLLALGAQPDLLPGECASDDYKAAPLPALLSSLSLYESAEEAEGALAVVRLLLQHGASPRPLPEDWKCPQVHEAVLKLLEEFGHPIP